MGDLLIIDDELEFGKFVARVARLAGFDPVAVDNVKDFRREAHTNNPAVIVMDLQMPDTDGIELMRELRDYCPDSRIILVSGIDTRMLDMTVRLGEELGLQMERPIPKPVRSEELRKILQGLRSADISIPPEEVLAEAIQSERLFLEYQPKYSTDTLEMIGVEALVRWTGSDGKSIPPDRFIPVAEKCGLIDRLTRFVARKAINQAGIWRKDGLETDLALNVSALNMLENDLPDILMEFCHSAQVPSEAITVELTETAAAQSLSKSMEILGRFRIKGFKLSIDDFGTGYSSIARLANLPFSELKIDRTFVLALGREKESEIIVKAMIDLAHGLGLGVTAEGVETQKASGILQDLGCDVFQGYYFGRPVSPQEIMRSMGK